MSGKHELGWCILELMGHRKLAGWVTEATIAGGALLRIDVPAPDAGPEGPWTATQYYSPSAIYAITPTTLDLARQFAQACRVEPVTRWELPALASAKTPETPWKESVYQDDDLEDGDEPIHPDDEPGF